MRPLILAISLALAPFCRADSPTPKPNIIVILADDLGYGDVQCFNKDGKIKTPNLDKLASKGVMFTDAHTPSAVCSPTRYGLMTGRYSWRSRLQSGVLGGLSPRLIEPDRMTLASLLKKEGYQTGCVGKWHLGMDWVLKEGKRVNELSIETRDQVFNVDYTKPIKNGPLAVGFDYYFGISASLDMVPYTFIENDRVVVDPTEDREFAMVAGKATKTRKGPTAPGFEVEDVLPALVKKSTEFIEKAAKTPDKPFFLYLPLTTPHTPIAPTKEWAGKSGLGVYGDFVAQTDDAVGKILSALEKQKLTENTLIVFTSDNGCAPSADFPDLIKQGHNPSFHFRGHKADLFEGGHRVPFIVSYPKLIKEAHTSKQLVCLADVFRTVADLLQVKVPDNAAEDSFSFLPILQGTKGDGRRENVVHHSVNGSFAIREGEWKLLFCPDSGGWSDPRPGKAKGDLFPPVQLYNLKDDISEKTNLGNKHPEVVKRLTELLEKQVKQGRSTDGKPQKNTVEPNIWKKTK